MKQEPKRVTCPKCNRGMIYYGNIMNILTYYCPLCKIYKERKND